MVATIVELFKTIVAAAGIFATAFLIWNRYIKHVPRAVIVARSLRPGSQSIERFLKIRNFSDRPILVSWKNTSDTTRLRIGRNQTVRGIVESMSERETIISIGPETEVFLPLIIPSNYDKIDLDNIMQIDLRWRFPPAGRTPNLDNDPRRA